MMRMVLFRPGSVFSSRYECLHLTADRAIKISSLYIYEINHSLLPFLFFIIIHMCIQGLGHFSPCPHPLPCHPLHPLPLPLTPSIPSRNYFALISNFVEEKV
jgi:hypothetical protein